MCEKYYYTQSNNLKLDYNLEMTRKKNGQQ